MSYSEIPKFLVSRRYISLVISFIVLFSVIFLLLYRPFSLAVWFSTNDTLRFGFTLLFYVGAIVILIFSRWLMNALQDRLTVSLFVFNENVTLYGNDAVAFLKKLINNNSLLLLS